MAATLPQIEEAFARVFANKVIDKVNGGRAVVPVYLDYPDPEEAKDQRYPSISIKMTRLEPSIENYDTTQDVLVEMDYSVDPPVTITRRAPIWYTIRYEVCAYSLNAMDDRELTRWIEGRFAPRHYLDVGDQSYSVFRESFDVNDRVDIDTVIYDKTWTYSVLAEIEDLDNDVYSRAVTQIAVKSSVVRTTNKLTEPTTRSVSKIVYNAPKAADVAVDAEKVTHRVLHFDDQNYWFDPNK